jgi:hypothetical protein
MSQSFALHGTPTQCEKLSKDFADSVCLPLAIIRGLEMEKPLDLNLKMAETCEQTVRDTPQGKVSLELVPLPPSDGLSYPGLTFFQVLPMFAFVDELHDLPELCPRRLLKATNKYQPNLDSEPWVVECQNVCGFWLRKMEIS